MKKLLSITLALALTLSMSVFVFAEDTTIVPDKDGNPTPETGNTTVSYEVQPAYTVTIPEKVELGSDDGKADAEVKADGVKVANGKGVVVTLTGTSDENNAFKVTTKENASLTYTVKKGGQDITTEEGQNTVLTVASGLGNDTETKGASSGSSKLDFAINETVKYAGNYSGTVTFTVAVADVPDGN